MADREDNLRLVEAFWGDLYRRDFDKVGSYMADDGLYEDVPVPDGGAVGPEAVAARLRIGLEPVEKMVHRIHRMVADDDTVMTEHTEEWHFGGGEVVALPFVSVHEIRDGKIALWRDYWNLPTLMDGAPQWWLDRLAEASGAP